MTDKTGTQPVQDNALVNKATDIYVVDMFLLHTHSQI